MSRAIVWETWWGCVGGWLDVGIEYSYRVLLYATGCSWLIVRWPGQVV